MPVAAAAIDQDPQPKKGKRRRRNKKVRGNWTAGSILVDTIFTRCQNDARTSLAGLWRLENKDSFANIASSLERLVTPF